MEKLLVIEDVQSLRARLKAGLTGGYQILEGSDRARGMELFLRHAPKVVLLDLGLPPDPDGVSEGFRCLEAMIRCRPSAKIIVLVEQHERETAYRAVASGAYDFFPKPVELPGMQIIIRRAFHLCSVEEHGRTLQEELERSSAGMERIAGKCVAVQELLAPLQKVKKAPAAEPAGGEARNAASDHCRSSHAADDYDVSITAGHLTLREVRDRVEKSMIHAAVDNCCGNMAKASELLGVSRPALYDLMKKHGLFKPYARQ
jgi:DNA-binding NtrC family response regulator